jgi:predicted lipid-binding transport protein (Tim44 family)
MESKGKALEITLICALFIVLALWGIIWDISSGLLASGIDGIMLLGVCAMMAGIFLLIALVHLNQTGVLPTPAFLQAKEKPAAAKAVATAPAVAKPAAPAASATVSNTPASVTPKPAVPAAASSAPAPATPKPAASAVPPATSAAPSTPVAPAKPAAPAPAAVAPNVPPKVPEQ